MPANRLEPQTGRANRAEAALAWPGEPIPAPVSAWLRRQARFAGGVVLLLFGAFIVVAILGWNVADPSFSHATDAPVTNWLGYPGAVTADLAMQFFGLAALAGVLAATGERSADGNAAEASTRARPAQG